MAGPCRTCLKLDWEPAKTFPALKDRTGKEIGRSLVIYKFKCLKKGYEVTNIDGECDVHEPGGQYPPKIGGVLDE